MSVVPFGRWTIVSRPVTSWTTTVPAGRVVRDTEFTGGAFLGRLRQGAIVALLVMVLLGECSLFPGAATAVPPVSHATLAVQPAEEEAANAVLAAAAAIFDALSTPDCTTPNPDGRACVRLESVPAVVARGIAHIGVGDANGIGGTNAILGRDVTGVWRVWFTTQSFYYQTLVLPSEMLVCADGAGANVRSAPAVDAAVITALPDLTQVTVEEFVLTEEQAVDASGGAVAGAGWYRLSAPLEGWTSSRLLSNTFVDAAMQQPACWARDQREGATEGGR